MRKVTASKGITQKEGKGAQRGNPLKPLLYCTFPFPFALFSGFPLLNPFQILSFEGQIKQRCNAVKPFRVLSLGQFP